MGDLSIYHRFCCAFVRTPNGDLISCIGPVQDEIRNRWTEISAAVAFSPVLTSLVVPVTKETERKSSPRTPLPPAVKSLVKIDIIQQGESLAVYESRERRHDETILGIILKHPHAADAESTHVLASLLLKNIKLFTSAPQDHPKYLASTIVDLFDARLRYVTSNDKWSSQGREFFFERVNEFVRRGAKLEFCLPAFPCKSSNTDKVSGTMPDRGEQIALEHLDSFVEAVEGIYEPGAKLWIVSDGHVFSDCIGVDDETVDKYNAELLSMYAAISQRRGGRDRVGFKSLVDLFDLKNSMAEIKDVLQLPTLQSYISTKRTEEADLSRQILDRYFKTDEAVLRSRIESKHHSSLKLYRGFSRFMLEDLSLNRYTKYLSRSQLRKLSSKVSFEMIQRNEAYSNLVELLFPHHVRLSIHAHDNSGPKFGIRLFGPSVRPLETLSFDAAEMRSVDLLHVPTPWHNCLVEVSGHSTLIMAKAMAVRNALSSGKFGGGWTNGTHQRIAGFFRLHLLDAVKPNASVQIKSIADNCDDELGSETDFYSNDSAHSFMSTASDADMVYYRASIGIL